MNWFNDGTGRVMIIYCKTAKRKLNKVLYLTILLYIIIIYIGKGFFASILKFNVSHQTITIPKQFLDEFQNEFHVNEEENSIFINLKRNGAEKLRGFLGLGSPEAIGQPTLCSNGNSTICYQWGDFATLNYIDPDSTPDKCGRVEWKSTFARKLEDCFFIDSHWYGGPEVFVQRWPMSDGVMKESPYVTGDSISSPSVSYGSLVENFWFNSKGASIHVDEDVPLFFSLNSTRSQMMCLSAKNESPYKNRDELVLKYSICIYDNVKDAQMNGLKKFYPAFKNEIPDETMLIRPIWSTWAQYKTAVNQSIVLDFVRRIKSEGFLFASQIEIDDDWENCYGNHEFNLTKFPDPKAMVEELKLMGFRVTLWIHPFININCESFSEALESNSFVKDSNGRLGLTKWWQGKYSGIIDFTNPIAANWWSDRILKLQREIGIDSFKFDAGETNWLPTAAHFGIENDNQPNVYSTKYVETMAKFGKQIEVRTSRRNQGLPIFVRMLDKDSTWGYDNGLKTLIPTLLQFSSVGYPFVLPDMIGGNAYNGMPSKELFIRWLQANTFMPSIQFSIVPWIYDEEVIEITRNILALREEYKDLILAAAIKAGIDGTPINRPMWWTGPTDSKTFDIEDQYMLGNEIVVAPVIEEGEILRNIFLPAGIWIGHDGNSHIGPATIVNYSAPLNVLPYFVKKETMNSI